MADNLNTRVSQLEESMARAFRAIEALADKEEKLDDALTALIEAQLKTEQRFRETDKHFRETDQHFRETDQRFRETDERFRETDARIERERRETDARIERERREAQERSRQIDERIDKLVIAIGEFIRTRNGGIH